MSETRGLSTLIEAARFLEVGVSNSPSSVTEATEESKSSSLTATSSSDQANTTPSRPKKGCLRNELQMSGSRNSDQLSFRIRTFHSDEMRQDHNRMEKLRRKDMRTEFDHLKTRIPGMHKGKHSNVAVLQSAVEYIGELKALEKTLQNTHQSLSDQQITLRQQLVSLQQNVSDFSRVHVEEKEWVTMKSVDMDIQNDNCTKRKRAHSDSTISADSPKMFIGSQEDAFAIPGDDKIVIALSQNRCMLNDALVSPSQSKSPASSLPTATVTPPYVDRSGSSSSGSLHDSGISSSSPYDPSTTYDNKDVKCIETNSVVKRTLKNVKVGKVGSNTMMKNVKRTSSSTSHPVTDFCSPSRRNRPGEVAASVKSKSQQIPQSSVLFLPTVTDNMPSVVASRGSPINSHAYARVANNDALIPLKGVGSSKYPEVKTVSSLPDRNMCAATSTTGPIQMASATVTPIIVQPVACNQLASTQVLFLQQSNSLGKGCQPVFLLTQPTVGRGPTLGTSKVPIVKNVSDSCGSGVVKTQSGHKITLVKRSSAVFEAKTQTESQHIVAPRVMLVRSTPSQQHLKATTALSYPTVISVLSPPATPTIGNSPTPSVVCQGSKPATPLK